MKNFSTLGLLALCFLPFVSKAQMWPAETLSSNIIGAWTRSGDFDDDGDPDILVQEGDSIYWYENLRPGWEPHLIDAAFYYSEFGYVDVLDLDGLSRSIGVRRVGCAGERASRGRVVGQGLLVRAFAC